MTLPIGILFYRPRGRWNQQRRYSVWVDGRLVCRLARGRACEVALSPGRHVIEARVARTASQPVELDVSEAGTPMHVQVAYAGKVFLFGALWRAFTFRHWLAVVPDLAPASAVPPGITGETLPPAALVPARKS